jgi:hypothetical protein
MAHFHCILKSRLQLAPRRSRALNLNDPSGLHFIGTKERREGEVAIFEVAMITKPNAIRRFIHQPVKNDWVHLAIQRSSEYSKCYLLKGPNEQ